MQAKACFSELGVHHYTFTVRRLWAVGKGRDVCGDIRRGIIPPGNR